MHKPKSPRGVGGVSWWRGRVCKFLFRCLPTSAAETHTFESWRMSEYAAGEVDYLLNHDGADAAGSSLLFTALAQYEYRMGDLALQGSWMGGSTAVRKTPLLNDHFTNTGSGQP